MAGEIIRDVIVRVRVEHGDTGGINDAARKAREAVNAQAGNTRTATAALKEQQTAVKGLNAEIGGLERRLMTTRDAFVKMSSDAERAVDRLIAKEKELQRTIQGQGGVIGRNASPSGPAMPTGGGPGMLGAFSAAQSTIGNVLIPVAVASMVPGVIDQITGGISAGNRLLFGSMTRAGTTSPADDSAWWTNKVAGNDPGGDLLGGILTSSFGRMLTNSPLGALPVTPFAPGLSARDYGNRYQESWNANTAAAGPSQSQLMQDEIRARQQLIDQIGQQTNAERTMLQSELGLHENRIRSLQAMIAAEEARNDAAREQFGLLDAQRKQDIITIAEKVASKGVGSLSKGELELVQGNQAFTGILSDQAKQNANDNGFQRVLELLGRTEEIQRNESQLELALEVQQNAKIELVGLDAPLEKHRTELEATMVKVLEEQTQQSRAAIQQIVRQIMGNQGRGPDF